MFERLGVDCRIHSGKDNWNVASFLCVSFLAPILRVVEGLRVNQQSIHLGKRILARREGLRILVCSLHSWAKRDYIQAEKRLVEQTQRPCYQRYLTKYVSRNSLVRDLALISTFSRL